MPSSLSPVIHLRSALVILSLGATAAAANAPVNPTADLARIEVAGQSMYALGFDRLSAFVYVIVDAGTGATPDEIAAARKRDQIPAWLRRYDGQRVLLTGYLLPLTIEKTGRTRKFILMKDVTTCCYGATPNMNDYVIVTMKGEGIAPVQDVPVRLTGVFRIAEKYEADYITSLFELDGGKYLGPRD